MNAFLFFFAAVLCAGSIVSCMCRVNRLNAAKDDRSSWVLLYTVYSAVSASIALQVLGADEGVAVVTGAEWFALVGIALNLWITRASWKTTVPNVVKREQA